jgi:hypothetical protein
MHWLCDQLLLSASIGSFNRVGSEGSKVQGYVVAKGRRFDDEIYEGIDPFTGRELRGPRPVRTALWLWLAPARPVPRARPTGASGRVPAADVASARRAGLDDAAYVVEGEVEW